MSPRIKRWLIRLGILLTVGGPLFVFSGVLIVRIDPLQHADAIYVLGGSRVDRWLEAVELYREGYAPLIILSPGGRESGEVALEERGIHVPEEAEIGRDVMVKQLGIPAAAVEIVPRAVDNTAQEADALRARAIASGWRRIIIITDVTATRRAGYAFRREFGKSIDVITRCSRINDFQPWRWWDSRSNFRATFYEVPKLFAYWLGLRG